MVYLNTKNIYAITPQPVAAPIQFVKPLSYEFRVAEYTKDDKITKVRLQVQIWEHDDFGGGIVIQDWKDVERIPLPDLS